MTVSSVHEPPLGRQASAAYVGHLSPKRRRHKPMSIDTLFVYCGVYTETDDALADYEAVKDLHTEAGLIDAYDAAVIERDAKGKVKIVKKHETPTRVGGVLGGGVGLATGLVIALFPAAAIGGGLLLGTAGGVTDMEAKVRQAMKRAEKIEAKKLKADNAKIEADASEAQAGGS